MDFHVKMHKKNTTGQTNIWFLQAMNTKRILRLENNSFSCHVYEIYILIHGKNKLNQLSTCKLKHETRTEENKCNKGAENGKC
jgi:hypothetical protein